MGGGFGFLIGLKYSNADRGNIEGCEAVRSDLPQQHLGELVGFFAKFFVEFIGSLVRGVAMRPPVVGFDGVQDFEQQWDVLNCQLLLFRMP